MYSHGISESVGKNPAFILICQRIRKLQLSDSLFVAFSEKQIASGGEIKELQMQVFLL